MRNFYLTFILLISISVSAQIQPTILDDFSDGNFTENPTWNGTDSLFSINGEQQLILDKYVDGSAYLSTPTRIAVNATWKIDLITKATTARGNLVKFYLISDNPNLTGELNGYYVLFGDTKDEIALYKQQGKNFEKIIDGRDSISEKTNVSIKITNDDKGNFTLYSKRSEGPDTIEGTYFDESFISKSYYTGVVVKYSKTYVEKYLFDNLSISGEKVVDSIAPTVISVDVLNKKQVNVVFSEQIAVSSSLPEEIETITLNDAKNTLLLEFKDELKEGEVKEFVLPSIKDLEENELIEKTINVYLPKKNDIVINEIMADPTPQVALPEAKYIELYNCTELPISLKNWQLTIGTKSHTIENGIINPKSYLLVCLEKDFALFEEFGNQISAPNISSMTISGGFISLASNLGTTIDYVEYSNSWYGNDEFKKDGGWSLERIDVNNHYASENNWKPSTDKRGGTPGQKNSIAGDNPDTILPTIKNYYIENDTIVVTFLKTMQQSDLLNINNYSLSSGIDIKSISSPSSLNNSVLIELEEPLEIGIIDTLKIKTLRDISGLILESKNILVSFPEKPIGFNDIVINEILFNPIGDGADFVELYNPTQKVWNLSEIFITNRKEEDLQKRIPITDKNELFFPNEYIVLTENPGNIKNNYPLCPSEARFYTVSLPSLPDAEGNFVLVAKDETIFDEFYYTEKMHHAFVSDKEGVSLERINPSFSTQSDDSWQSAASVVGYATPGYKNSQYYDNKPAEMKKHFGLVEKSFSPDNDGFNDLLQISYKMESDGFSASISIYSAEGILIRKLYNNQLLSTEGVLFWDGTNNNGSVSQIGVYIAYIEYLHPEGKKGKQKLVFSLTSR